MALKISIDTLLKRFEKEFIPHNRIEVSRSALLHNVDLFSSLSVSGESVIPVVKGNGYGHGTRQVAEALKTRKFPYIAVNSYFEALRIREVSDQPVLVMGAINPDNFARVKYDNFAFVVQDERAINALGKTGKNLKVHLECNTGMNRYGADPDELKFLTKLILSYPNLTLEGLMSHLADGDGTDPKTVEKAVKLFDECVDIVRTSGAHPSLIHLAQSAGSLKAKSKYANAFRLGIGLYGINPFSYDHPLHDKLKTLRPALRVVSTITKVTELKKGDRVSYNYTFTAPKDMKIGAIPFGYYEGMNRSLSNVGVVKVGEKFTPITGRVCMNHTMISLDGLDVKTGDEVVVYSNVAEDKNTIDCIARDHNLFNYNLLTALSRDVRRVLVD